MNTRNIFTKLSIAVALAAFVATGAVWELRRAHAASPNSDPTVFGVVNIVQGQAVRLSAVCSMYGLNGLPPDPCRGTLEFHDASGNEVQSLPYELMPGHSISLEQGISPAAVGLTHTYTPCLMPAPDNKGRAIPSIEVFDTASGKTEIYVSPIPRLSNIQGSMGPGQQQTVETSGR